MSQKPNAMRLLDILESQLLSFAAQASAAADVAGMLKQALSGGAQGASTENDEQPLGREQFAALVGEEASGMPRTFGDGKGSTRKPKGE